jgi:hypothetical protein
MHIPLGIGLAIYLAVIAPGLYRKWKAERAPRRTFGLEK